jgi:hypothetical protein
MQQAVCNASLHQHAEPVLRVTQEDHMAPRRPRDIEAELKALQDRARQLKSKQKAQLGELLMATGAADTLDPDALAGVLLDAIERAKSDKPAVEGWRKRGETFFRRERAAAKAADAASPANGAAGIGPRAAAE